MNSINVSTLALIVALIAVLIAVTVVFVVRGQRRKKAEEIYDMRRKLSEAGKKVLKATFDWVWEHNTITGLIPYDSSWADGTSPTATIVAHWGPELKHHEIVFSQHPNKSRIIVVGINAEHNVVFRERLNMGVLEIVVEHPDFLSNNGASHEKFWTDFLQEAGNDFVATLPRSMVK